MILSICDEPRILEVFRIIKLLITIIKIVVPLILIISGMITFIKAIQDSETSKALNVFVKKCIAAILIFLIPTFVSIIANVVGSGTEYANCFKLATKEGIQSAYNSRAKQYVLNAKNTLNYGAYQLALTTVNELDDAGTKSSLLGDLEKVNEEIKKAEKEREEAKKQGTTGTIRLLGNILKLK